MKLNGVEIKTPQEFNVQLEKVKRNEARTASGRLVVEDRGQKLMFSFKYNYLKGTDLDVIRGILENTYIELEEQGIIYEVATTGISFTYYMKLETESIYSDVEFELIER